MLIHLNKPKRGMKDMQAPIRVIPCYLCHTGPASLPDGLGGYLCEGCYDTIFQAVKRTRSGEVIRHSLKSVIINEMSERHLNNE